MHSSLLGILNDIQGGLNAMVVATILANTAMADMRNCLSGHSDANGALMAKNWAESMERLSKAQEVFLDHTARLEEFLNGKG